MAKKSLSHAVRIARREARELATLKRTLQTVAAPARVTTLSQRERPFKPIHDIASWQPAIPGSYRWLRERRIA